MSAVQALKQLPASLLQGNERVAVVGLGYVGLPLAVCLAKRFSVLGFDVSPSKVAALQAGRDPVGECGDQAVAASGIAFSADVADLSAAKFIIVCVPTPIDEAKRPDLTPILAASKTIGQHLTAGSVVVYESTVYPGCTEEDCVPVLERESGLSAGKDFWFGYSPERINPGDREHTVDKILKVVSGSDADALECIAQVYDAVITAGIHRAPTVKVAEAAKVIENTQRDLNIALVNELALIFNRLDIDTRDVLAAAGTKWNFLPFQPGLVGGHCIGVDPYYLTHRAERADYHPQVILAGRRINDAIGPWVAQECIRLMGLSGARERAPRVLVLGITFKENCPDCRNSKVVTIIAELQRWGCEVVVCDPVADAQEVAEEYGVALTALDAISSVDACIAAVAHTEYISEKTTIILDKLSDDAPFMDVKAAFDREVIEQAGLKLWRL